MKGAFHRLVAALAHRAGPGCKVDADGDADSAHVEHVRHSLERHRGLGNDRLELLGPLEQTLVAIKVERRNPGGAGKRMRRIGIAVEQLDDVLRPLHESLVEALARDHTAHRHGAGGHPLGKAEEVGRHPIALRGKGVAETAEAGDDLVEDQQDAMLVADRTQALKIALGWRQHAG